MRERKASVVGVLVLIVCLMCGCGGDKKASPEKRLAKICGTWAKTEDDMTTTYTLNTDGTFTETVDTTGAYAVSLSNSETYTYDGENLELYLPIYDASYSYTVTFDGVDMIWHEDGYQMRYVKQNG